MRTFDVDTGMVAVAQAGAPITVSLQNRGSLWRRISSMNLLPSASQGIRVFITNTSSTTFTGTVMGTDDILFPPIDSSTANSGWGTGANVPGTVGTSGAYWADRHRRDEAMMWPPGYYLHIQFYGNINGTQYYRIRWWELNSSQNPLWVEEIDNIG